jgi:regulator of protease activity HflC (stomatin/prohibitin superfamily)
MVNLVIGIIGLVGIAGSVAYSVFKRKLQKLSLMGGVVFLAVLIFSSSFTIIPTGYTGVRTTFGQIDEATLQNGFNYNIPVVQSIEKVNNKQQDIVFDDQVWSETSERTALYFEGVTVTYQINPEKSAWIFANVSNYEDSLVSQSLVGSAIKSSSKELSSTDVTNRSLIEPLAQEKIQSSMDDKYGEEVVIVAKVVISNIDFEDSYNEAIAEKQNAQLTYEKQKIENQKAVETAEAEAEAVKIKAEGEAEANKILSDSLSEDIFQQMMLDKWNGELPKVVSDSGSVFDVTGLLGTDTAEGETTE